MSKTDSFEIIVLPPPSPQGKRSLEEVIAKRRSVRAFTPEQLTDGELSQLLWSAQGVTGPEGSRAAPTAGALYPLELYVASAAGLLHYEPENHHLVQLRSEDLRRSLFEASWSQESVLNAPATFIMTAVYDRTAQRYGHARAQRYVHMEVGHAAQNLLLQAVALGLGGVPVGAFEDERIRQILRLPPDEFPLYLIPVGHPA